MATDPVRKIVLTHRGAARGKYGSAGWSRIRRAVTALATADAHRGITTRFVALDSAADACRAGVDAVADPADAAAVKAFVDAVHGHDQPAYLLLLGGPELVAGVPLTNPLWTGTPEGDPDRTIASDLPYACDVPYSTSPSVYNGPTRVVGRLPDLVGVADPDVLVEQLAVAAAANPADVPASVFAVSTRTWRESTRLSVSRLPVAGAVTRTCPDDGPMWTKADLAARVHFVNCHGGELDPHWYGERSAGQRTLPVAVDGPTLGGLVAPGTVVAAECCYGTAQWAPAAAGGARSVAMTYLTSGAVGVFGASTTAYGPASGNEYADVIARMFAAEVMGGASLGRAALAARQAYVAAESFLDPTSLTTLAQFTLLGDPSVHPFAAAVPKRVRSAAVPPGVGERRAVLSAVGSALLASTSVSADRPTATTGAAGRRVAVAMASAAGLEVDPTTARAFPATMAGAAAVASARVARRPGRARELVVVRERPGVAPEVRVVRAK